MTYGFVAPTNKVVAYGQTEIFKQEFKTAVATIKPGHLVAKGADDSKAVLANIGTKVPVGVCGYEQSFLGSDSYTSNRPATKTTAFASGAEIPALAGTNFALEYHLAAGFGATKGDRLCTFTSGTVVPYVPALGGYAVKIPFTKSTTEVDTGIEIPANVICTGAFVEVTSNVAASTIDVGLLSTEDSGDADGFLDGVSCANAGFIMPVNQAAAAASLTAGELISTDIKSADGTAIYFALPKEHVFDGTTKTVSYTTSDHAIVGNIYLVLNAVGMFDVGNIEKTVSSSTSDQLVMAKVNI